MENRTLYILVGAFAAIIIIGGVVGGWVLGQNAIRWQLEMEQVDYHFEETASSPPDLITLNVNLAAGAVNITFVDNSTLIYRIDVTTNRWTLNQYGDPTITYSSNTIVFDYEAAATSIFLGNGANYTINTNTAAGSTHVIANQYAHLGDVSLETTAGALQFELSSTATINGNVTVTLVTSAGGIDVDVQLPSSVSGSFLGTTNLGSVNINAVNPWSQVTANNYETTDFGSTTNSMTIDATTNIGAVSANLS
ncbi:MAG: hypothetical protein ACFFBX_04505 [Promethearchaeota archaeon]